MVVQYAANVVFLFRLGNIAEEGIQCIKLAIKDHIVIIFVFVGVGKFPEPLPEHALSKRFETQISANVLKALAKFFVSGLEIFFRKTIVQDKAGTVIFGLTLER